MTTKRPGEGLGPDGNQRGSRRKIDCGDGINGSGGAAESGPPVAEAPAESAGAAANGASVEEPPVVESAGGATNGASAAETRALWERDSEAKAQAATDTRLLADQVAVEEKKALACKAEHGVYSTMHGVSWTSWSTRSRARVVARTRSRRAA